jgi:DNA replication protein DnaC
VGGTGLGKTHLSTAVAKTVIERGFDVLYVSAIDMFADFEQKQFGNGEDNTRRYFDCDLLISTILEQSLQISLPFLAFIT